MDGDEVREALKAWGRWQRSIRGVWLAYAKRAHHVPGAGGEEEIAIDADPRVPHVERAMRTLRAVNRREFRALCCEYIAEMDALAGSSRCKLSLASYRTYRRCGERFVAGALAGNKNLLTR